MLKCKIDKIYTTFSIRKALKNFQKKEKLVEK